MATDGIREAPPFDPGKLPDASIADNFIGDWHFIRDLKRLKDLRSFLIQEAVLIGSQDSTNSMLFFGALNTLKYDQRGRMPTLTEWSEVEQHTQALFRDLSEPLRRKFLLGEIPKWMNFLPIAFGLAAVGSLFGAIIGANLGHKILLPCYLFWLTSMGAIGSIAFVGMNALSVQQDITFDLSNRRLMVLRITLGALFGLVLSLPFGYEGFHDFLNGIANVGKSQGQSQNVAVTRQALLLLLPFIFGFSTSLVIMVLNKLIDAVQAFFGRSGDRPQPQPKDPARLDGGGRRGERD